MVNELYFFRVWNREMFGRVIELIAWVWVADTDEKDRKKAKERKRYFRASSSRIRICSFFSMSLASGSFIGLTQTHLFPFLPSEIPGYVLDS